MSAFRVTRSVLAMVVAATLSLSCSGGTTPEGTPPDGGTGVASESAPEATPRSTPESGARIGSVAPTPDRTSASAPASDPADGPRRLAEQLDAAAATLRDDAARSADLRRAGELQQLAVRRLTAASGPFRRAVLSRLRPDTEVVVRACLAAAAPLRDLTEPQRRLPRWRIVAPPRPDVLLGHYRAAQRRTRVPWEYLAAIHLTETRMGRIRGTSTAGAKGPMQFLPSTWEIYGAGGDINDPRDAILAAARLLKANGAPRNMAGALYRYNPSDYYVRAVTSYARSMRQVGWAYTGYWQWQVLYRHVRGTYVLPVGYPEVRPELLDE